jgi:hypothetical protein
MKKPTPVVIQWMERSYFLTEIWHCKAGEHVTIIGPTGQGKTTLCGQLLEQTATEQNPVVMLVMKPKDSTADAFTKKNGYRKVRSWPPPPTVWKPRKPKGFTLWPKHTFNPEIDDSNQERIFRTALRDSYKKGNRHIFADELYSLDNELGLGRDLVTIWTKGRSMGVSLWGATQKPTHVPLYAYNQATHLFLSYDPDKRSVDRFREIAGVDPDLITAGINKLAPYEWLYIRREGRNSTLCIVGA